MPVIEEGPFLKEERLLMNAVSERIGRAIERIRAEQQLEVERTTLENKNIALREVLEMVEDAMACGAAGVALGRNVWQSPDPTKMTGALVEIVHQGKAVSELSWP